jgi:hypothetical protein
MIRAMLLATALGLSGCAATIPAATWTAIAAGAGAAAAVLKLDDDLLTDYERLKGNKVTLTPIAPPATVAK